MPKLSELPIVSSTSESFKGLAAPLTIITAVICLAALWLSACDHPLYSPDEGRYGTVSKLMAESGNWLVPMYEGQPHLTKPPLTYWSQAICIKMLGSNETAVRLPSLITSSLTLLLVLAFAWRLAGSRVAALSVGTLVMMPLYMIVGRLATTDAMLSFFWLATLICGYLAVHTSKMRFTFLMWFAVAAGLMTKGPIALVPLGILLLWLALSKRMRDVKQLHLLLGLPIALTPLVIWVVLIAINQPKAIEVWEFELLNRITGSGDHPEPLWYLIPIFFVGLFPATAMLTLPGRNISFAKTREKLRIGDLNGLLVLSVVVPLILFSLVSGKLVTYLLPLCAPLALLNGQMLERWITLATNKTPQGSRLPEVVATLSIVTIFTAATAVIAAAVYQPIALGYLIPMLVAPASCLWLWWLWKRRPQWRTIGLTTVWASWMFAWVWFLQLEDYSGRIYGGSSLVDRLADLTGEPHPMIVVYGFSNPTLNFYNNMKLIRRYTAKEVLLVSKTIDENLILIIDDEQMPKLIEQEPQIASTFEQIGTWQRSPTKLALLLRPRDVSRSLNVNVSKLDEAAD